MLLIWFGTIFQVNLLGRDRGGCWWGRREGGAGRDIEGEGSAGRSLNCGPPTDGGLRTTNKSKGIKKVGRKGENSRMALDFSEMGRQTGAGAGVLLIDAVSTERVMLVFVQPMMLLGQKGLSQRLS